MCKSKELCRKGKSYGPGDSASRAPLRNLAITTQCPERAQADGEAAPSRSESVHARTGGGARGLGSEQFPTLLHLRAECRRNRIPTDDHETRADGNYLERFVGASSDGQRVLGHAMIELRDLNGVRIPAGREIKGMPESVVRLHRMLRTLRVLIPHSYSSHRDVAG